MMRRLPLHFSFCLLLSVAAQALLAQSKPNVAVPVATFNRVRTITTAATPGEPWVTIGAVQMDRSGGIYVAFPDENTIRHFSSSGTYVRSIGRKGSGPGEFERLAGIGWLGDTLWARSRGGQRFELFRASGAHIRTQTALATSHDGFSVNAAAMLQDGWIAYNGSISADAMLVKQPRVTPMLVVQPPNTRLKEYARIATGTLTLATPGSGMMSGTGRNAERLRTDGLVRFAPDGSFLVSVDRAPKPSGATVQYTVNVRTPSGASRLQRTFTLPGVRVKKEHSAEFVTSYVEGLRMGPRRQHFPSDESAKDYVLSQLTLPTVYPAVSGLLIGADHNIWLRGLDLGEPNVEWTVFNSKLEPQFRVMLPADIVVKAAMRDDVWGTSFDDDDVPYLIHFRRAGSAR